MIKIDIEGSEIEMLNGSLNTIIKNKPKIAISAYHNKTHFYEIINFFRSNNLKFELRVGHHPLAVFELEYYITIL